VSVLTELSVTIGGRAFPLVQFSSDAWKARDMGGLFVHRFGRRWRIAIGVHGLSIMAWGKTLAEAEADLDEQLEPVRLLIGAGLSIPGNSSP
jgi:hypothetical protein